MAEATLASPKTCQICTETKPHSHSVAGSSVRPHLEEILVQKNPAWSQNGYICIPCLNATRNEYVRLQMEKERGEITAIESEVLDSLQKGESVVEDMNREFDSHLTFGERAADHVASFGGSWKFIILFFVLLSLWIVANSIELLFHPVDPYPFILLNLMMSLLASIQAPIIMMSQNRAGERDRLRAENDFKVNLKSEIEVRAISDKLDQLMHNQWARLMEIQQMQLEMLEDLTDEHAK
ncbi:MAG TPA: DUF1003 domain-containing protein [Rhizomicrobium sp.]|jgi:uncharacterized membrane protein|nr:DUF1003 domain-containing protein [Rhizomicrobium sp.]